MAPIKTIERPSDAKQKMSEARGRQPITQSQNPYAKEGWNRNYE